MIKSLPLNFQAAINENRLIKSFSRDHKDRERNKSSMSAAKTTVNKNGGPRLVICDPCAVTMIISMAVTHDLCFRLPAFNLLVFSECDLITFIDYTRKN